MYFFLNYYILPLLRTIWSSANKPVLSLFNLDLLFRRLYRVVASVLRWCRYVNRNFKNIALLQVQDDSQLIYRLDLFTLDLISRSKPPEQPTATNSRQSISGLNYPMILEILCNEHVKNFTYYHKISGFALSNTGSTMKRGS